MPVAFIGQEHHLIGSSMQAEATGDAADNQHERNLSLHDLRLKRLSFALLV
jgi:hypothetical protein